ncbi:DUF4232 domain-containing protein [Streptomyces fuscigenes]|uniref:DUF4232 domain-containing protein n=1 Tax=Streptomyces fuscigenes TaxID=1528880 RepID=UPI001F2F360F|nr:DUF4232 domain-containing protein [Streptomyces fuscigenes]MCF3961985.1 DUF4232 domain-containing protein [Streptomyces fuscigenes]
MGRTSRTVAAAATGALLLAGTTAATAAATPAAARTPTCRTADLSGKLTEPLAGGMNHAGNRLVLTNTGGRTCALRGYPGLGLENAGHRGLPTKAQWGSTWYAADPGVRTLTLAPGRQAQAVVSWTHTGNRAGAASYLEITPPASTSHLTVPFRQQVDGGTMQVTALSTNVPLRG